MKKLNVRKDVGWDMIHPEFIKENAENGDFIKKL